MLADALMNAQVLDRVSDVGQMAEADINTAIAGLDSLQKDSLVRNSVHLFSPRQQLFALFLAVQAKSETGDTLGEQRAMAVVWRDPYKDENGLHRMFVRQFKWLWD